LHVLGGRGFQPVLAFDAVVTEAEVRRRGHTRVERSVRHVPQDGERVPVPQRDVVVCVVGGGHVASPRRGLTLVYVAGASGGHAASPPKSRTPWSRRRAMISQ